MKRSRAFTLIELLIVVAIIALLIAILLPSLNLARKSARTTICLSNARSMGMATQLYVNDWQRMFPYATDGLHSWTQLLMNGGRTASVGTLYASSGGYGATDKMRICPEAPVTKNNPDTPSYGTSNYQWANSPETGDHISGSYAINGWIYNTYGGNSDTLMSMADERGNIDATYSNYFYNIATGRGETLTPVFCDANWRQIFAKSTDPAPTNLVDPGPADLVDHPLQRAAMNRHNKAVNVSFLDAHAQTVKLPDLWTLHWSANWVRPASLPVFHY